MLWLFFAIASAFFAGVTAILAKIGVKKTDSTVATAIRTVVILVFSWLLVFLTGAQAPLTLVDGNTLLFLILSGLSTGASWLFYFKALVNGDVNKVAPIDKSSTILTILLAFLLLGEPITLGKGAGIIVMGLGTWLMLERRGGENRGKGKKWLLYAILSAVFASLTAILGKVGITHIDSNLGTAIRTVVVLVMAWAMVFVTRKQGEIRHIDRKSWLFICLSGVTTGLSWLCYYRALQDGQASVVVPIDKLSIVVTVALSWLFLKERLTKKSFLGLVLIVAGTFCLLI